MTTTIDPRALEAISALQRPGKPDLLARVVQLFKSESLKAIAAILEGLDTEDLQSVRNAAHTLKSSSAYVGAKALSERCRDLEGAARDENEIACIILGDGIEELFEMCCVELDQYMAKVA